MFKHNSFLCPVVRKLLNDEYETLRAFAENNLKILYQTEQRKGHRNGLALTNLPILTPYHVFFHRLPFKKLIAQRGKMN